MERLTCKDWIILICCYLAILSMLIIVFWTPSVHAAEIKETININKIIVIESNGNPLSYNKHSGARGICQITPILLTDYNKRHDTHYTVNDLFKPSINIMISQWYLNIETPRLLRHFKQPATTNNILWAYNAGIGNVVKSRKPRETVEYIKKYNRLRN